MPLSASVTGPDTDAQYVIYDLSIYWLSEETYTPYGKSWTPSQWGELGHGAQNQMSLTLLKAFPAYKTDGFNVTLVREVLQWRWAGLHNSGIPGQGTQSCWGPMAPHSSTLLPGKSHGWRSLVGSSPWGREESDTAERLPFHVSLSCIGEGNGNRLQCCLENPRDRGAWWAAIYGVA